MGYPENAGYKDTDTSREAAEFMDEGHAENIECKVFEAIRAAGANGLTADEATQAIGGSPFSVRPRITKLRQLGLVCDSGERRAGDSGMKMIVWVRGSETRDTLSSLSQLSASDKAAALADLRMLCRKAGEIPPSIIKLGRWLRQRTM